MMGRLGWGGVGSWVGCKDVGVEWKAFIVIYVLGLAWLDMEYEVDTVEGFWLKGFAVG